MVRWKRSHGFLVGLVFLAGCGYVGDPLPPALNIPAKITDLEAVQRGSRLQVAFTLPTLTTEGIPVSKQSTVDLRVGIGSPADDAEKWASEALVVPATGPGPRVSVSTPSAAWAGKEVAVAARLITERGRKSEWSNVVVIRVQTAIPPPIQVGANQHPGGVIVTWKPADSANAAAPRKFRVWRQISNNTPVVLATVSEPQFVDSGVVEGVEYTYQVQLVEDNAESDLSSSARIVARDAFPPSVPTGLTAVVSISSIELGWQRSPETDTRAYNVYRGEGDTGPMVLLGGKLAVTAFSDKQVVSGSRYRYTVTAIDAAGNESAQSASVPVNAP